MTIQQLQSQYGIRVCIAHSGISWSDRRLKTLFQTVQCTDPDCLEEMSIEVSGMCQDCLFEMTQTLILLESLPCLLLPSE